MKISHSIIAGACLIAVLSVPRVALGFAEDVCKAVMGIDNCVRVPDVCVDCATDGRGGEQCVVDSLCVRRAVLAGFQITVREHGRSTVHTDATYYLAQAAGLDAKMAYEVAAYDQAVDLGQFLPFDENGWDLDPDCETDDIGGFERTSFGTGGHIYHFVPPTNGGTLLDDRVLDHIAAWAYGSETLCTGAVTKAGIGTRGVDCPLPGEMVLITRFPRFTTDTVLSMRTTPLGDQIAREDENPLDWRDDTVYASELEPAQRFGVYLHALQDSISHGKCLQHAEYDRQSEDSYLLVFDDESCAQDDHAYDHFEEIGVGVPNARTQAALQETYDALIAFVDSRAARGADGLQPGAPFSSALLELRRAQLIGTIEHPGIIARQLADYDADDRVHGLASDMDAAGYDPFPGTLDTERHCPWR